MQKTVASQVGPLTDGASKQESHAQAFCLIRT